MTQPTINLTQAQIIGVVGDFLSSVVLTSIPIVLGQVNLVPPPNAPDYVVMWPLFRTRMAYNATWWAFDATTMESLTPTRVTFQFDVHGPNGAENAQLIATLWNDEYAQGFFDGEGFDIRPTFIADARQIPFLNAASQLEMRWTLDGELQGNFTISTPVQFADTLDVGLIDVDVVYPPA